MIFCDRSSLLPILAIFSLVFGLSACGSPNLETDRTYTDKAREKTYAYGSLAGEGGGITLFGGKDAKNGENSGISVNGYLWRATLDTIAFMPIASADPFGGLINTDWYSVPGMPDERTKLSILILDRELRADGVRVTVFRQIKDGRGEWLSAPTTPSTATALEETILTRARQLRLAQKESTK